MAEASSEPPPKKLKLEFDADELEKKSSKDKGQAFGSCDSKDKSCDFQGKKINSTYAKEEDVGISEYVSPHPGFFAILKRRYSDFMVHEIALDGSLVQLTNLTPPVLDAVSSLSAVKLEETLSAEEIEKLQKLSETAGKNQYVDLKASSDKEQRTLLHRGLRETFPSLESKTMDAEDESGGKVIRVSVAMETKASRSSWPRGCGNYCKFVLYKENKDTMEAVGVLAKIMKMKSSNFQYGGTKDRRAITTQNITAFRVPAERLLGLNSSIRNIKIGNCEYVSEPLKLGSLSGNRFTVVLRNVSGDDHVINDAMSSLRDAGFINYFGMQRFGTSTIPTYQIGRCLLHSDWQGAIDLILKPRPGESEELSLARQYYWETKDVAGTLTRFPRKRCVEVQLLQGMERRGPVNDLLGALKSIPRNTRLMYVHSYQSFVWNKVASWRIQELGLTPVVGDLVWKKSSKDMRGLSQMDKLHEVQYLTEDNVSHYTINDVVIPLPGYDVLLPKNRVGGEYHKLLEKDGFSMEKLNHKVKDFALSGCYRNLIIKPEDTKWEVLYYDDVTLPLSHSDLDILETKPPPQSIPGAKDKALKVEFSLPSGAYATMAIRELLKMDTSSHYQSQLNSMETNLDTAVDTTDK